MVIYRKFILLKDITKTTILSKLILPAHSTEMLGVAA